MRLLCNYLQGGVRMRRVVFGLVFMFTCNYADSTTDCTAVFEERKSELIEEIEKIDEARQANEALKAANDALYEKKLKYLQKEQAKNEDILRQIKDENEKLAKKNKENKELIASINDIKNNKLSETYNKMKDGSAAAIMESMERGEAANILFTLPPKKVSKIMAKMDPTIASELTVLLTKGPPFIKEVDKSKK